MSVLKVKDGGSWFSLPAGGVGVPSSGTANQILAKTSGADYATGWRDPEDVGIMAAWVKLWQNASPTSDFAEQTVSLDMANYDAIAVYAVEQNSDGSSGQWFFNVKGQSTESRVFLMYNGRQLRYFHISGSGVMFSDGYGGSLSSNLSVNNAYAIPRIIYGIKGVIST